MRKKYITLFVIFLSLLSELCEAQDYQLIIQISNQPNTDIILSSIEGDKLTPMDTAKSVGGIVKFRIPEDSHTGVYRLTFGKTVVAEVLNEPPQQLDFIFNKEDIQLKTDFEHPEDSLQAIESLENKAWFSFLKKEKALKDQIEITEKELDYYQQQKDDENTSKFAIQFNQLQEELASLIKQTIFFNPNLYVTKLIKMEQEPFVDGNLSQTKREQVYKTNFFINHDFSDESLMNSEVYTKKIFNYLMRYAQNGLTREQQETEFMNAIDMILSNTNQNEKVYEFVLDYLVRGFESLGLDNLIPYIAENYSGTTCQTDEVSTLERKLLQQMMTVGTTAPDFTLNDINGDPCTLSQLLKSRNLLIFWASWCPHCNEMIPQILNWQKSADLNDLEIIAISLDDVEKEWKDKVFETGIEGWYNLSSLKKWDCPVVLDYNVYATPTMFVIDKERKIIGKPLTLIELQSLFSK